MSGFAVEDFSDIATKLKKLREEKEKAESKVEDGKTADWTDVSSVYGYPSNAPPDLTAVGGPVWNLGVAWGFADRARMLRDYGFPA